MSANEISIRLALDSDARAIAEVHVNSWRAAYRGIFTDEYLASLSVDQREQMWRDAIATNTGPLVAELRNKLVGFASSGKSRDDDAKTAEVAEIYAIYLTESAWGLGVAQALYEKVIEIP